MPQTKERKREYMRGYMRTWKPTQKVKENKRNRERYREASLYSQRKSEGLCIDCGNQPRPGLTLCQQCQDRRVKERQARKRKAVQYLGNKCVDCGLQTDFMSVYDFHHKDADKCILLCANCHRIRHERENNDTH